MKIYLVGIVFLLTGCTNRNTIVDKSRLRSGDYRLFQDTPAWNLAKAVEDGNSGEIKNEINKNIKVVNFREPRFGQSLLKLAVMNRSYESVKTLLEFGADPNLQDSNYGNSPLMEAADLGSQYDGADAMFLKLMLRFGGDPNEKQHIPRKTSFTPLMIACQKGNLDYVKILLDAGAKLNATNEYGDSALAKACISAELYGYPEIVIYLIEKGVDYKMVLYTTSPEGEKKYITDDLREWRFDLKSDAYKKKMALVAFLKRNGMDYRKTAVPEEFKDMYPKEYLEKY